MADSRRYALGNQLDIEQLLLEAQHRWLRPAEICQILQNYKKFRIAPEPPHLPPSGSLFIFDKKVLRYFRKDGHNWRKKKDGKTIKEAHEKLKVGSIDVLHCYYAHGEDNEHFQRRSYWLLEEELSHIVLVHYREVQANRDYFRRSHEADGASPNSRETQGSFQNSETENSASLSYDQNSYRVRPEKTDTSNSALASEFDDVESAYTQHASSTILSSPEFPQPPLHNMEPALSVPFDPALYQRRDIHGNMSVLPANDVNLLARNHVDGSMYAGGLVYDHPKQFGWGDIFQNGKFGAELASPLHHSGLTTEADCGEIVVNQGSELVGKLSRDGSSQNEALENHPQMQAQLQNASMAQQLLPCHVDDLRGSLYEQSAYGAGLDKPFEHGDTHSDEPSSYITVHDEQLQNSHCGEDFGLEKGTILGAEQNSNYFSMAKHLIDNSSKDEVLKKNDSFNRWMSKELGDVNQSGVSSSTAYWPTVESENQFEDGSISSQYILGISVSDDQLFSIIDFSPNWAYAGSETKVLITGKFLKNPKAVDNVKWSCMFGELEVPASIAADGVLCCITPRLSAGRVPFCITCSNRVACSEVREFEYRDNVRKEDGDEVYDITSDILKTRFERLLSTGQQIPQTNHSDEVSRLSGKISFLIKDDDNEWAEILRLTSEETFSVGDMKDWLVDKTLKEKLYAWLLQKASEGVKGPCFLDEDGQGVLHYAAALGHDWAFSPTIEAGVHVNFRDKRGWTALHWAAFCGRERTVAYLVSLGAAPGALTDPNPEYPMGRTAADLASSNSHKGIAGYLAEAALSDQLNSLELKDGKEGNCAEASAAKPVQVALERAATPSSDGDCPPGLSLKDSLAAVCNATQAAARIHQVYRVQSFQRKQIKEFQDKGGISDEDALSMLALKTRKSDRNEPVQAAVRIQNKFRSWKGRKDFLMIRQQVVKIQAHFRGHQARKNYKSFVWSVGIVEKVILRWRRKGAGLRSKSESSEVQPVQVARTTTTCSVQEGTSSSSSKDDVYDILKEGRKQTEGRVQKALARVKSMVQYPEAREQYRRMLNVVQEIGEIKGGGRRVATNSDEAADMDSDLIDLDLLLDDDTFMPE